MADEMRFDEVNFPCSFDSRNILSGREQTRVEHGTGPSPCASISSVFHCAKNQPSTTSRILPHSPIYTHSCIISQTSAKGFESSSHRFGSSCFDYLHRCCHAYLCHQVTTNHNELDGITSVCRLNTGGLGGKEAGFLPLSVSQCNSGVKHSTDVLPVLCRISACTSRCLLVLLMPKLEGWRFTGTGMTTVEFAL